jgi:hypothetical protein
MTKSFQELAWTFCSCVGLDFKVQDFSSAGTRFLGCDINRAGTDCPQLKGHRRQVVEIESCFQRMRGGSQAHLVKANSRFYVAKFAGNPQGNRTLVNERIADCLAQKIGISVAPTALLRLSDRAVNRSQLTFQVGSSSVPVEPGIHLGSLCPASPTSTRIYDILPLSLLPKVTNLYHLGSIYAFDRWLAQTDKRQAVFVRERASARELRFHMYLVDHGFSFGGSEWQFRDSPRFGRYIDGRVYHLLDMPQLCGKAIERITSLSEADIYDAVCTVPDEWISTNDRAPLLRVVEQLDRRRRTLSALVDRHLVEMAKEKV